METALRTCMDEPVRCGHSSFLSLQWHTNPIVEAEERQEEHHQLPFVENVSTNGWSTQEEVSATLQSEDDKVFESEICTLALRSYLKRLTQCIRRAKKATAGALAAYRTWEDCISGNERTQIPLPSYRREPMKE